MTLYCADGCEPRLSINNIRVFNKLALAYDLNGTPGIFSGNQAQLFSKRKRITGKGSIDTSQFRVYDDNAGPAYFTINFENDESNVVENIYLLDNAIIPSDISVRISPTESDGRLIANEACDTSGAYGMKEIELDCSDKNSWVTISRMSELKLTKVIVLGTLCKKIAS